MDGIMYKIYVNDLSKLENYGFVKEKNERGIVYHLYSGKITRRGRKVVSMSVYEDNKKLNLNTMGGYVLKVICELYKNGLLDFIEFSNVDTRIQNRKTKIEKLQKEIEALENAKKI